VSFFDDPSYALNVDKDAKQLIFLVPAHHDFSTNRPVSAKLASSRAIQA
jgi:hypothetical protein